MSKRRAGRELALKILFQIDIGKQSLDDALESMRATFKGHGDTWRFAESLARMVREHQAGLDALIIQNASGWTLERMASIDRNVLRLALAEMLHCDDIPISVSINEAVELAKIYSTAESGKFVNGILGNIARMPAMQRDRSSTPEGASN